MTDEKWIAEITGKRGTDVSLSQAEAIVKMVVDGDLVHIDGPLIQALAELADQHMTEYLGVSIRFEFDGFVVSVDECADRCTDAFEALFRADDHVSGKHPLTEPDALDAEIVHQRASYTDGQIITAGRGDLLA